MKTSVLIADDALFMRSLIRGILEASGRFDVVGEASTGPEVLEMYPRLRPAIVTMDVVMPGMNGIETTRRLLAIDPSACIVVCTALGQQSLVMDSITAGARDFIVKPFTDERVLRVLDAVAPARAGSES
jgi:two-component system chemotaxis response regulator CheY